MNIIWFLDREFDVALDVSARLATIKYLERDNNIKIVTGFRKEKKYTFGIKSELIYLNRINLPFLKTLFHYYQHFKFLKKEIDLKEVDAIYINSNNYFLLKKLVKIRPLYKFKLILDVRSLPIFTNYLKMKVDSLLFKKCLRIAANHFDGITYITSEMRRYCEKEFKLPEYKSAIWSSGVDVNIFKPLYSSRSSNSFRLMYHGVVPRSRGLINIVKALNMLREYNIKFFLLGSGEEISELKELVYRLGLEEKVHFHSPVSFNEVPEYINRADVGILPFPEWPAWNTSSPIKLFEYLACGKPVIVTKIPAHVNVLRGRSFAFWAETSSFDGIAKAILDAKKNRKHFEKIGKEARDFVEKNYTWEKQLSELEKFLNRIQC